MSEPDRSSLSGNPDLIPLPTATAISPKLGRVRSGSRIRRDPSGLWSRLAIGSIAVHGVILTIVLAVSYRASEARRASVGQGNDAELGAIEIGVIALPDRETGGQTGINSASNAPATAPQAPQTAPQTTPSIETNSTRNTSDVTDQIDPNTPQASPPNPSPTNPTPTPAPTPPTTSNDDDLGEVEDQGNQGNSNGNPSGDTGETSGGNAGADPNEQDPQGNDSNSPTGNGEDTNTSTGDDRLGLIVRLTPLASVNPDPDRDPAQLTAPAANIDLPVNADPALLPDGLAIPFAIALHVELSIDPNGIPSLVRILEPDRDRELPQFEPFVEMLIEGWRFEAASSVANGREVDQLDIVLALQWR